jgi:quercetin dioxygenase-like cupin family protein
MEPDVLILDEIPLDQPIELLTRRKLVGDQMLFAHVHLAKGCHVAVHQHESEQIAFIVSGRVKWTFGQPGTPGHREQVAEAGTVIRLPSNFWHGVDALEDTVIVDILSPPGPMGVDAHTTKTANSQ